VWSDYGTTPYTTYSWTYVFNGIPATGATTGVTPPVNTTMTWTPPNPIPMKKLELFAGTQTGEFANYFKINGRPLTGPYDAFNNASYKEPIFADGQPAPELLTQISIVRPNSGGAGGYLWGMKIDDKELVNTGVPGDPGTETVVVSKSLDSSPPTITVDGGDWVGTDGTGQSDGERVVRGRPRSGSGTVSVSTGTNIVLREDNGQWIDGFFVSVPEQKIASRNVLITSMGIDKERQKRD